MCFFIKFGTTEDDSDTEPSKKRFVRSMDDPKILIIGAGAAGIACATKLLEYGFKDIRIVEAENRIGGRIETVPFADNNVDMGAQWCHGENHNVVYKLVKDKNLLDTSGNVYVTYQCIRSNGELVDENVVQHLKKIIADIFAQRNEDIRNFEGSLGDYLHQKYYAVLGGPEFNDIDKTIAYEFFENFKKIESAESAAGVDEVSACGFNEYWECTGDYMLNWKDKGYIELLRLLIKVDESGNSKEFGILDNKINFGCSIKNINWDREDGRVEVMCENGEESFLADHVVVTMSLGVLKESVNTLFNPQLTQQKKRAIEGLGFGSVGKIFLEFENQFWPNDWTGFSLLWRDEDYNEVHAIPGQAWLTEIYGFYCVNYQPRVLLAWIVGSCVNEMEILSKEEIQKSCMFLLNKFLPAWRIPEPINVVTTSWYKNPNFRGAYSFRSMKTEQIGTSANDLSQPLTVMAYLVHNDGDKKFDEDIPMTVKPVVLFAGEATSKHYYSTVHGAIESGWREASRLAGYYNIEY